MHTSESVVNGMACRFTTAMKRRGVRLTATLALRDRAMLSGSAEGQRGSCGVPQTRETDISGNDDSTASSLKNSFHPICNGWAAYSAVLTCRARMTTWSTRAALRVPCRIVRTGLLAIDLPSITAALSLPSIARATPPIP